MKAYVVTSGAIFGLLTVVHLARIGFERHLASEPIYILLTVASAGLCIWAWRVLSSSSR